MFSNKLNYRIINIVAFLSLIYIAVTNVGVWWGIISNVIRVLLPFIIAFVVAYCLNPLVKLLQRKNISNTLAIIIVVLLLLLGVISLLAITLPLVYEQLALFVKMISEVIENVGVKYNINLGGFEIKIEDYLNDILKNVGQIVSATTIDIINSSVNFISKLVVGFVGFIYFLVDMDKIRENFKQILISINKRSYDYFKCLDIEIGNYLKGLGIFTIIQLFEYSFLFFIVGHPNWLLLGILACVTTVIPYFGGLITNIIAVIAASVVSTPLTIATVIICLIFPQLDGYVISPKIYGKTNDVNPLITIMAVSVGGTVAGIGGIVAALPCYLLIRTTYNFFKNDLRKGMNIVKETI